MSLQLLEPPAGCQLGGELAENDDRRRFAHALALRHRFELPVEEQPGARVLAAKRDEVGAHSRRRLGGKHRADEAEA